MSDVTQVLQRIEQGDGKAAEELLPLVYEELRKLATQKMAREQPGQTLQATALVHEAWLRLVRTPEQNWQNRAHFFRVAAECMRRIRTRLDCPDNPSEERSPSLPNGSIPLPIRCSAFGFPCPTSVKAAPLFAFCQYIAFLPYFSPGIPLPLLWTQETHRIQQVPCDLSAWVGPNSFEVPE